MLRVKLSVLVVLGLMLSQAVLAQEPLDVVGPDAALVVRVKAPKATSEKVAEFAGAIDPGLANVVKRQSASMGVAIHNLTLDGVDQAADWWVAVYPPPEGENNPSTVFIIPATDLKKMKAGVPEEFTFFEHGKYGVYSKDEEGIAKTKPLVGKKGDSISKAFDAASKGLFDKGDVSVFVNVSGLATKYKDHLAEARQAAEQQIENMPVNPAAPGLNPEDIAKVAKTFLTGVFQAVEDSQSFTLAVTVSKSSVNIEELLRVKSGSGFDKVLQKSPPSSLDLLGSLPAGCQIYMGTAFDMAGLLDLTSNFTNLIQGDEATKKALAESIAELKKLKYGPVVGGIKITPAKSAVISSTQISQITPTQKLRDISRNMATKTATVEQNGFKQVTKLEADKETYGSNKADVVTMKFEPGDDADPATTGMIENLMNLAFGEEGLTQRFVYLPEIVVQTMGGGKTLMQQTLDAIQKKGAGSSAIAASRTQLGKSSNLLLLIDLPNLAISAGKALSQSGTLESFGVPEDLFSDTTSPESYIGFSAATEPQGLRMTTVVPVEQVQGIVKLVGEIQAMRQQ
jgi:hypothetical protein